MMKIYAPDRFDRLPDAILFDTDNTLYPYDPAHAAAQQAVREKVSTTFSIRPEEFDTAFKQARDEVKSRLQHTASSHSRLLYLQRMLEIMGLGSQVLLALDFEQTYWRTFLSNAILFDDVKELLDDLRLLGIPTAIVTDLTAQIQFRKVVYFGLDQYFDYIVTSEEAGFDKPHPAPFTIALEKMRPKGNTIWMIGDNPVNDIRGAARRSMQLLCRRSTPAPSRRRRKRPGSVFQQFFGVTPSRRSTGAKAIMTSPNTSLHAAIVDFCARILPGPAFGPGCRRQCFVQEQWRAVDKGLRYLASRRCQPGNFRARRPGSSPIGHRTG
ncbi:HAD family hydrolase [Achromobacter xylosoxidans]